MNSGTVPGGRSGQPKSVLIRRGALYVVASGDRTVTRAGVARRYQGSEMLIEAIVADSSLGDRINGGTRHDRPV